MGQLRNEYVSFGALLLITATGLGDTVVAACLLSWAGYLSPWMPRAVWLALGLLGVLGCGIAASSAVAAIAAVAPRPRALHRCLLVLLGFLALELLSCAAATLLQGRWAAGLRDELRASMSFTVASYPDNATLSPAWDEIQHEMSCCGVASYEDWFSAPYGAGRSVPPSCCLLPAPGCGQDLPKDGLEDIINLQGCLDVLSGQMLRTFKVLSMQAILPICVIQILMVAVLTASQRRPSAPLTVSSVSASLKGPVSSLSASLKTPSPNYRLLPSTRP